MRNKIAYIILAICFLVSLNLSAQLNQANNYFTKYNYSKAIPLYLKVIKRKKDDSAKKEATIRLADCYRLINNSSEASNWYEKAVSFDAVNPENYFYLGTTLRSQARYDEAEKAFEIYANKQPSDVRGKIYAQYCRDIKQWENLTPSAEIKNAAELNSPYSEFGSIFYENYLIFTSDRDIDWMTNQNYHWTSFGYLDLFSAPILMVDDLWSNLASPAKMSDKFNQPYHDGPASFTSDFHEIFTTRTFKNGSKLDSSNMRTNLLKIFYAKLTDKKDVEYLPFPYNNENYSVGHPAISANGKKLIFSSDMPGGHGKSDLYQSEFIDGKWSNPVNLSANLNTFGNEVFPFLANDSTLFFASDGLSGFGGLDIYESQLIDGNWTTPWNLKQPINSPYDDFSIVFNKKLTDGFFSSTRPGGKGSDDIYAFRNYTKIPAEVLKPVIPEKIIVTISGFVKNKKTMAPLDSASLFILNSTTKEVLILKTNPKGYFETAINRGNEYIVKAMKPNFFNDCLNFSINLKDTLTKHATPKDLLLDEYTLNQTFKIDDIYYDLNKWFIREEAKPSLDKLISILNKYPINVEIGSHTDCRASSAYNNTLSQKRAESVVEYLVSEGIDAARLTAKGYGETLLVNKCTDGVKCSEAEHQANRRTEFKIISIDTKTNTKSNFNPELYKSGQIISVNDLKSDFFDDCQLTKD